MVVFALCAAEPKMCQELRPQRRRSRKIITVAAGALAAAGCAGASAFAMMRSPAAASHGHPALRRSSLRGAPMLAQADLPDSRSESNASSLLFCSAFAAGAAKTCILFAKRKQVQRPQGGSRIARAAAAEVESTVSTSAQDLADAKAALEAAQLELEAAKLRAEIASLEKASIQDRRASRARLLLGEGDGKEAAPSVDATDLRVRLKKSQGIDFSEDSVQRLIKACKPSGSTLSFDDLTSETFEATLSAVVAEEREAKRKAEAEEAERAQRRREEEARMAPAMTSTEEPIEVNDDRGFGTRLLAILAYLLPLMDGLRFGLPLVQLIPALLPPFAVLTLMDSALNTIPFGSLILFFIMSVCSNNRELPVLLRFNLQQAVLLDVFLFIPSLLGSFASFVMGGNGSGVQDFNEAVFILLCLAVAYSWVCTAIGQDPDGIPFISNASRRSVERSD